MPRITPRAVAYDNRHDQVVVLAQSKKKHLLVLDDDGLKHARAVPAPSETFWMVEHDEVRYALFWAIGKLSLQPLEGGRGKSLESYDAGTFCRHSAFSNRDEWWGIDGRLIYRFRGDKGKELEVVDGFDLPGHAWMATNKGAFRREIGGLPGDWKKMGGGPFPHLKSTTWISGSDTFVVAEHSGRVVFVEADGKCHEVKLGDAWCVEHHDRELYVWSDHQVQCLDRDGSLRPTGMKGETHSDDCLFSTPRGLFFLEGTTLHCLKDGEWAATELEASRLGL